MEKQVNSLASSPCSTNVEEQLTFLKQEEDSIAVCKAKQSLLSTLVEVLSRHLDTEQSWHDSTRVEVEKLQTELVLKKLAFDNFSTKCNDLEVALASEREHHGEVETSIESSGGA